MLAISDVETITLAIVAFLVFLGLAALLRVVLKRESRWSRIRVGVFLERDHDHDDISGDW